MRIGVVAGLAALLLLAGLGVLFAFSEGRRVPVRGSAYLTRGRPRPPRASPAIASPAPAAPRATAAAKASPSAPAAVGTPKAPASPAPAGSREAAKPPASPAATAPPAASEPVVEVVLWRVLPTGDGGLVLLVPRGAEPSPKGGKAPPGGGKPVRVLPIGIGLFEAAAIQRELEGVKPPRPMTHDLLASVLRNLGATLERVTVTQLRNVGGGEGVFYGELRLRTADGRTVTVDSRPSDALALAARTKSPIFVEKRVLEKAGKTLGPEGILDPEAPKALGKPKATGRPKGAPESPPPTFEMF